MNAGDFIGRAFDDVVGDPRWGDIKPQAMVPPSDDELTEPATRAVVKLQNGKRPEPVELEALTEGFRIQRPSLKVVHGDVDDLPKASSLRQGWAAFLEVVRPLLASVGRIDRGAEPLGTGFLVGRGLVVTNKHVATRLIDAGLTAPDARIAFGLEDPTPAARKFTPITKVRAMHPSLDLALLDVSEEPRRTSFTLASVDVSADTLVAAIGYPFPDSERNPLFAEAVFDEPYGVERVSPGETTQLVGDEVWHDCSTLGGNSGSPLVSRSSGELVGVHFDGSFLGRNKAILASRLATFIRDHEPGGGP